MMGEEQISSWEAGEMGSAIDTTDGADWENIEEEAPSVEDSSEDSKDEEIKDDSSESDSSDEDSDSRDDGEKAPEEADKDDSKAEDSEDEDSEGEAESDKKDAELVEVKVNGNVEKVSLDDLKANYSGKVAYDKKFSEFDRKEKQFQAEMESVNNYINELGTTMKNSSTLDGVYKIGELVNMGPHQMRSALIKELMPEINRLAELSDVERNLEYSQEELQYNQEQQQKNAAEFEQRQSEMELQSRVGNVMRDVSANDNEWNEAVEKLDSLLDVNEEMTPELVGDYVIFARAESRAESLLGNYQEGNYLKDQTIFDAVADIMMDSPDMTDDEIVNVLDAEFGNVQEEKIKEEVEKVSTKKSAKKPKTKKVKANNSELQPIESDDWDDIL